MIDDPSTEQRACGSRQRGESCPGADRFAPLTLVERCTDQSKRTGNEEGRTQALHSTRRDELCDARRKATPERGRSEDAEPDDK